MRKYWQSLYKNENVELTIECIRVHLMVEPYREAISMAS